TLARFMTGEDAQRAITPDGAYKAIKHYAGSIGIDAQGIGAHALRATAATNALQHGADLAKVQEMLGHANVSTTRLYDRRGSLPKDSAVFRVRY
ncbi:MAG: tyrosine-type recombinase/integrase, partial [Brachymonas sp.]|nr:tyrosine-type recombinase/integrase [Brachymonas sp.]